MEVSKAVCYNLGENKKEGVDKVVSVVWLVALVLFAVLEGATIGLVSIWFSVGALVSLVASVMGADIMVQCCIFLGVSLASLLVIRPMAQKHVKRISVPTNSDRVIGQEAIVTQTIDNVRGVGAVKVFGQPWMARSEDDSVISAGDHVKVLRIEGVKLYVESIQAEQPNMEEF